MPGKALVGARRRRRGSSTTQRRRWSAAYAGTPYDQLMWFDAGASSALTRGVRGGFLSPPTEVIDIGCGAGSNLLWLARHRFRAFGIDLAAGAVEAARHRAAEADLAVDVRVGDALDLPFRRGRFGAAMDHGCFHTIPLSRRREYVGEVARVVRPGGAFLLAWVAREFQGTPGPRHRPSVAEVASLFESNFQIIRTEFRPMSRVHGLPSYVAWMRRRTVPQPTRR